MGRAVGPWKVSAKVNLTVQRNLDAQDDEDEVERTERRLARREFRAANPEELDDEDVDRGDEPLSDREWWG